MDSNAAMHVAAASGDVDTVVSLATTHPHLIDAAQIDQCGRTPLYLAAQNGHAAVVETLHRLGSTALDRPNNYGITPLHAASRYGRVSAVVALIRLGSTTLDHSGIDVLTSAFLHRRMEVARLLLAAGVDVAALADEYPQQVQTLLATSEDRLLELRHRLYFSRTLLDVLLGESSQRR